MSSRSLTRERDLLLFVKNKKKQIPRSARNDRFGTFSMTGTLFTSLVGSTKAKSAMPADGVIGKDDDWLAIRNRRSLGAVEIQKRDALDEFTRARACRSIALPPSSNS